jgi:hypothetical protein
MSDLTKLTIAEARDALNRKDLTLTSLLPMIWRVKWHQGLT